MPNDTPDTPAAAKIHERNQRRRLDATCPACAGAVTADDIPADGAMHETERAEFDRLYRECLSAHEAETHGWGNGATTAHGNLAGFVRHMLSRRAAIASARPADDGLTAAYLYGVEHGRDARARPDSQPTPNASQVGSSASARPPGAEALLSRLDAEDALLLRDIAAERDADAERSVGGKSRRAMVEAMTLRCIADWMDAVRALAAPAPAPAPVGEEARAIVRAALDRTGADALGMSHRLHVSYPEYVALHHWAAGAPARGAEGAG